MIDTKTTLKKNEDYGKLPNSYVIFICKDDIIKLNKAMYHFKMRLEDNTELGDGANIIFVNGSYEGDDAIGDLMNDFVQTDVCKYKNMILAKRAAEVKDRKNGIKGGEYDMVVTHFDRLIMKEREEALSEGVAKGWSEGRTEEALDTARRMLTKGKYSLDEIADVTALPIEKVKELADSMTA